MPVLGVLRRGHFERTTDEKLCCASGVQPKGNRTVIDDKGIRVRLSDKMTYVPHVDAENKTVQRAQWRDHLDRLELIAKPFPAVRRLGTGSAMPWAGVLYKDDFMREIPERAVNMTTHRGRFGVGEYIGLNGLGSY